MKCVAVSHEGAQWNQISTLGDLALTVPHSGHSPSKCSIKGTKAEALTKQVTVHIHSWAQMCSNIHMHATCHSESKRRNILKGSYYNAKQSIKLVTYICIYRWPQMLF